MSKDCEEEVFREDPTGEDNKKYFGYDSLHIVKDILTEILSEQEWGVVDWVEVWRCWVGSALDTHDQVSWSQNIVSVPSPVSCTAIDGNIVYSGNDDGGVEVRNIEQDNCVIRNNINDGKVYSICLIKCFNLVLIAGETNLHFYRADLATRTLTRVRSDFIFKLGANKHLSVFGPRFSAANDHNIVNVFEIFYVGQIVRTSLICAIKQVKTGRRRKRRKKERSYFQFSFSDYFLTRPSYLISQEQQKWVQWKLWREKIIGMNSNGEILVYSLLRYEGELMYKSEPYTVVLYKNPSWIFRYRTQASESHGSCKHQWVKCEMMFLIVQRCCVLLQSRVPWSESE